MSTLHLPLNIAKALAITRCKDSSRSKDSGGYGIVNVNVIVGDGTVTMATTTGHMLLKVVLPYDGDLPKGSVWHIEPEAFLLLAKAPISYCPHGLQDVRLSKGDGGFPDYAKVIPGDIGFNALLLKDVGTISEWLTCTMTPKPSGYGFRKSAGAVVRSPSTWRQGDVFQPVRIDMPHDIDSSYTSASVVLMPMRRD